MGPDDLTSADSVSGYERAIVRLRGWAATRPTAGIGLLVSDRQIVTCAHVVNTAIGRDQREQSRPAEGDRVQVEFPLLPGSPIRVGRIAAWAPPPEAGEGDGDVCGLELDEQAPGGSAVARFAIAAPEPGRRLRVFGYPGSPARDSGAWVDVEVKGDVGGGLRQVESLAGQTVKAQPGYSGSPVWDHDAGQAVGLLHAAPFADEPERDAYLLRPDVIAAFWPDPFDYLLVPGNPYRGLEPFTAEHAELFFGRAGDVAALAARVRTEPLTIVAGPSGVGKSSLVHAGLIPALAADGRWSVASIRPGQDPWLRIAAGLQRARQQAEGRPAEPVTQAGTEQEVKQLRAAGFGPTARFLRSQERRLMVVIDQFEELLAAPDRPDAALLDLLLPSPEAADEAVRLVLTLRSDFLPVLQSIPGIHTRLNGRLYLLSPLTTDQMRQAVERPAEIRGVALEPGLADQIIADAASGALPLLEFTLTRLWGSQRRRRLTFAGYHEMGGVRGALDRFAEEQIGQAAGLDPDVLARALLRLVRTTAGGTTLATRQRVLRSAVPDREWAILQRLADVRLVILDAGPADGEPYAELAHESLIMAWQRLRDLVSDNAEFLSWLSRIRQRAADGDAIPDARIAEARRWLEIRPDEIPGDVRAFVESSETAAEARLAELRAARDRADQARARAEAAALSAEALRLAADSELALGAHHGDAALALAVESVLAEPTLQGDMALRHVMAAQSRTLAQLDLGGAVWSVAFSADGQRLAAASHDGTARVYDAWSGAELVRVEFEQPVQAVAFSPDGGRVAAGGNDSLVTVFDAATGAEVIRIEHDGPVSVVAYSADGRLIASGSADGTARVWDAGTGAEVARIDHDKPVWSIAFSPDGASIVTGGHDWSARVSATTTGAELARVEHDGAVWSVAFSPDGTRAASGSYDDSARVFAADGGAELARLEHRDQVASVAFSPDGTRLLTGSHDRSARVFDIESGSELVKVDHEGAVWTVAFSPHGDLVATGSGYGMTRVLDASSGREVSRIDVEDYVRTVTFSPDGGRVAAGCQDGSVRVFLARPTPELLRIEPGGSVHALAFSPDGGRIATAGFDDHARVYDAASGAELVRVEHEDSLFAIAFSPDGSRLVTGGDDEAVRVIDAASGTVLGASNVHSDVNSIAFHPNGRWFAAASFRSVRIFATERAAELHNFEFDHDVRSVAFRADGRALAIVVQDAALIIDPASGEVLKRLGEGDRVMTAALSPDGSRLATGADDVARIFDLASGDELVTIDHDGSVEPVVFSPDGALLATCAGPAVRIFDAATGTELARITLDELAFSVAFSPDGERIAISGEDLPVHVVEALPEHLVQRCLDLMTRPLTAAELKRYGLPADCRHAGQWRLRHPAT